MQDRPTAAELLEAALEAFTRELLPETPKEKRYVALMIANAIGIVARDLATSTETLMEERKRLQALFKLPSSKISDKKALRDEVEALNCRLAEAIRDGAFDAPGEAREKLKAHLLTTTREKLRVSNPKLFEQPEGKGE
ncbi:MAG: hypothetical protein J4G10_06280 [Alphaproteobacteria bacterium]|nr:hypothetical protein [Alphaproteobacteria bacterium]